MMTRWEYETEYEARKRRREREHLSWLFWTLATLCFLTMVCVGGGIVYLRFTLWRYAA
jgi:hypothetical protein